MLEQSVPEGLHPVERTHAGPVLEELQPVGRAHVGEICEGLDCLLWKGPHAGAGEECEEEGVAETMCDELTTTPIPCSPVPAPNGHVLLAQDFLERLKLLKAPSNLTLNTSNDGASTNSLGNLFQCPTTLIIKKILPYVQSKPTFFQFKTLAPCPVTTGLAIRSPQSLLFSRLEQPQLSQPFFIGEVFQPSDHFCGPPLDPLEQVHVFLVLGAPELDAVLQPVLMLGVVLTQVQDLALGLVEPHEVRMGPTSWACPGVAWTAQGPLSSPARQQAARQDLPLSRDASQGYSSRLRDSLPQQILGSGTREICEEQLPVKTEAKKLLSTSVFSMSLVTRSLISFIGKPFTSLTKFSSSCALAFLIPSLYSQAVSLYSFQDTCPCFHCLCISFLHFSLTRRSLLSHAGLLPSLPDFLHMGIESSCALRIMPLKSCLLCSAPLSLRGLDYTFHLAYIPRDHESRQGTITAAQAATNIDLSNKFLCVGEQQVHSSTCCLSDST
ncbi:hypothetical protein QYF61_012636 [Mycteria americana]|uniref:Uncharacterized protein n=1 Tax=Mycteria americana TaxID=33587 RepID=A0AAN7RKW0_MYCAM|nr:hypothetical protein QYF61_012636 [Mycteria americana]